MQEIQVLIFLDMGVEPVLKTPWYGCLLLTGLLLLGCMGCRSSPSEQTAVGHSDTLPVQEFYGKTTIYKFEEDRRAWILESEYIAKYAESEKTLLLPVDLVIFGKEDEGNSTLIADTGVAGKNFEVLEAMGNVVARSNDGKVLETDYIQWVKRNDRIISDKFVKLTTETGDVMTGIGFESDASLSHWKINKNFKAVFRNIKDRINDDEKPRRGKR